MKAWRERIHAARERGGFSEDDMTAAASRETCAVGCIEVSMGMPYRHYTSRRLAGERCSPYPGWTQGVEHSAYFTDAVFANQIDDAERLLDAIEDRAIQIKREAQ